MKGLSSRKQFLIAESELGRARLSEDVDLLKGDLHTLTRRIDSYKAVASSVALVVTALAAFQRGRQTNSDSKSSWLKTLLKGAGIASTVWLALQSPGRER